MFEALRCALKSNQPSVSGTNCNEEISENALLLALDRRCAAVVAQEGGGLLAKAGSVIRAFAGQCQSLQPVGEWTCCGVLV